MSRAPPVAPGSIREGRHQDRHIPDFGLGSLREPDGVSRRRERRPYRPGLLIWLAYGFIGWAVVLAVVFALAGPAGILVGWPVCAAFAWWSWRMAHIGIFVEDDGIVARRAMTAERLRWGDVVDFAVVEASASELPGVLGGIASIVGASQTLRCPAVRLSAGGERRFLLLNSRSAAVMLGAGPDRIVEALRQSRPR